VGKNLKSTPIQLLKSYWPGMVRIGYALTHNSFIIPLSRVKTVSALLLFDIYSA
jgi:hypothetical protein